MLSPGTEKEDLGTHLRDIEQPPGKWDVYERYLQVPYYAVFSRYTGELRFYVLVAGKYHKIVETTTPNKEHEKLHRIVWKLNLMLPLVIQQYHKPLAIKRP